MAKAKPGRCEGTYITLIAQVGVSEDRHAVWEARCDCGTVFNVRACLVGPGRTVSCGCKRRQDNLDKLKKAHAARSSKPGSCFDALLKAW
jgi:hypothetical protein